MGAECPEGTLPSSWFRLRSRGRQPALGFRWRPVPMHPWPSPCRQSKAFPEMIAISPASLSTTAEPCQVPNHTLSLHSMSEQTCVLSINVSVDHRWAFPSQPSRAAEAASSPRGAQGPLPLFLPGPGELPAGLFPGSAERALTQGLSPKEAQLTSPGAPWEEVQVRLRASF